TTGTNSYAGETTVSGGTLSLAGPNLADEAAVTIANGAVLNLNFSGTDTIGALTIGANPPLADGEYSNATHPTFITGSGILKVESVTSGFAAWAAGLGLSGNADDDFDKDGITDAVEYVLGTDPKASNASGIQMQKSGSDLIVTFSRSDDSETPDVALFVEAGGTLQTWPQVFEVKDITGNSSPGVEITENGTAPDTVKVIIPTGGAPGFFARLKVVVTGG
nr:hypothetical protein [Akkermansiaceae bacterium]